MELIIRLVIWIVKTMAREIRLASAQQELRSRGIDPKTVDIGEGESAAQVHAKLEARRGRALAGVTSALARGEAALNVVDPLERDLSTIPGGKMLRELLRDRIRPTLTTEMSSLRATNAAVAAMPPHLALGRLQDEPDLERTVYAVARASVQVQVLSALRDSRAAPEQAYRLADADAIASALLRPIQEFAFAQQVALPVARPISAPASKGGEAIWFELLPDAHPIIFVPADFHTDLFRYASVPHELGHLLWRDIPGLAAEVRASAGFVHADGMITVREGRLYGSIEQLYSAWMSEIWADMVAVLLLGPAALRGLLHSFASPDAPDDVVTVAAGPEHYDEHPPAHVRMHLAAHVLGTMGFEQEAKRLSSEWDTLHGTPEKLVIPLDQGRAFTLSVESVLVLGRETVGNLYAAQYVSVSGFRLGDVPGMEMGPGLWAKVLRRAELLASDTPFNDDGRVVLAAAIQARVAYPGRAAVITRGLRRAVLGRDADEHRVADAHYGRKRAAAGSFAAEVRGALLLREVLERKPMGERRGGRGG